MAGRDKGAENQAYAQAHKERQIAQEEQMALDKLKADEKKAQQELKARGKGMQGGGRSGLMYGQNYQGVK